MPVDGGFAGPTRLDLRSMLRLHEGLRLKIYSDTTGHRTIGYGHNLENGITKAQAEEILALDIDAAVADVMERFPWTDALDPARFAVLVDMTFNMGIGTLATFTTTLGLVRTGDYVGASEQMMKSLWSQQVGVRARRLSLMMKTGLWPTGEDQP